jgi:hypothetical protein
LANIQITVFNGTENPKKAKHVVSKYEDESFIFANYETETLTEAFQMMTTQFTLSQPLNLKEPTVIIRDQKNIRNYTYKRLKNIILDLDEIKTKEDYLDTIQYFKDNNFSCILGKSRSWNGVDVFNMKGILRVSFENNYEVIKTALTQIQIELGSKCKVDLTVGSMQSYQAPSHSKMIVHCNEKGVKFTDKNVHIENVKKTMGSDYKVEILYDNDVIDECISIFSNLGYMPIRNSMNENGAINFRHSSEVKSPGGFFWFSTQPLVMNHPNKDRTISIFNLLKDTEVGKKWLKNKTKEEQKHQLIKDDIKYSEYLMVNERYLDFNDTKKKSMIKSFIESDNDVLKIKSAMGTAKSNGVAEVVKEAHDRNLKVILISNRVSVAQDFAEKYNMMWYKDANAWKQNQSIVVQFDSLHRFDIDKFDVVVLDEFISLLFHHRSNLTNNSNINIVKFKIWMETKKVLVADAFLTGFENIFFEDRNISMIDNSYRDKISLTEYTYKETFVEKIISEAKELKEGKKISASFTSNNIMKAVNHKLKKAGVKVIMLNAETPQYTRDLIYKRFKEFNHKAYDVLLYSPTLTVGVSNLNDIDKHFHYDSGMSTDVISSLQMIKRSRNATDIHFFLEERQFYYDTDVKSINSAAEANINNFYNNKNATLLIDVDYNTGKLKLTELGKYVNKIEAFFNITKNNHANAFRLLLEHQFTKDNDEIEIISKETTSSDLRDVIKEIKENEKEDRLKILQEWKAKDFSAIDIDRLKSKSIELTDKEKAELLIGEIQEKFKEKLSIEDLKYLAEKQIQTNFKYISMIGRLRMTKKAFASMDYSLYLLSQAIGGDISSLQNKSYINFLEYLSMISTSMKLKQRYSKKEIESIDLKNQKGTKFLKFLKSIGYVKGEAKWYIDDKILEFSKKI